MVLPHLQREKANETKKIRSKSRQGGRAKMGTESNALEGGRRTEMQKKKRRGYYLHLNPSVKKGKKGQRQGLPFHSCKAGSVEIERLREGKRDHTRKWPLEAINQESYSNREGEFSSWCSWEQGRERETSHKWKEGTSLRRKKGTRMNCKEGQKKISEDRNRIRITKKNENVNGR